MCVCVCARTAIVDDGWDGWLLVLWRFRVVDDTGGVCGGGYVRWNAACLVCLWCGHGRLGDGMFVAGLEGVNRVNRGGRSSGWCLAAYRHIYMRVLSSCFGSGQHQRGVVVVV